MIQKTCLYDNHVNHQAKIVEFGGFLMPLEYSDITSEHLAVRNNVGVFDCSHMGEILITGKDTLDFLNYLLTCDVKKVDPLKMTYGMMLYENGTVVDDLMVYKVNDEKCMLVVNASNTLKDYAHVLASIKDFNVTIENKSDDYGQLALQGPNAITKLQTLTTYNLSELKFLHFDYVNLMDKSFVISRSGYTGSDGFEIYGKPSDIVNLFEKLYSLGVVLCGLGCRDTLRFEAAMPLYGHEINDQVTPLEAGLSFGVSFDKGDFIGKNVLLKQKEEGLTKKLVGIELLERGIARGGYELYKGEEKIGEITTGYMIPNTNNVYALGFVKTEYSNIGEEISVLIRNRKVKAVIRNKKFLNKEYAR